MINGDIVYGSGTYVDPSCFLVTAKYVPQRANVPTELQSSTSTSPITDLTTWGPPSAAYPSTACNIPEFFSAQNLVFDITLCGDW